MNLLLSVWVFGIELQFSATNPRFVDFGEKLDALDACAWLAFCWSFLQRSGVVALPRAERDGSESPRAADPVDGEGLSVEGPDPRPRPLQPGGVLRPCLRHLRREQDRQAPGLLFRSGPGALALAARVRRGELQDARQQQHRH